MSQSHGSQASLAYEVEDVFGTVNALPSLKKIPYKTHSLDLTKNLVEGEDQYGDRMRRHSRHGTRNPAGSLEIDLRSTAYDDFIASALMSDWSGTTLKTGGTQKFFTIEEHAADINKFRLFNGLSVSQLNVSAATDQAVQTTLEMVGSDMIHSNTSAMVGSPADADTHEPFDTHSGLVLDAGTSLGVVTSLDFSINNSFSASPVIGQQTPYGLEYGNSQVSGTLVLRYVNADVIQKFIDEVESSLSVTFDDSTGTNGYTFTFPRIKYNGGSVPVSNPTARLVTLPFVALFDSTEGSDVVITRPA